MSLFNDASFILIPSGYKAGTVFSQKPTDGDGDLTFTRASDATRVNSDGEIEVVGSGVPRLDYSQGSCPALLLEPQRTNLLLRSEDLTNGWNTEGLTITANQTTAPDGNTTADTLQETAVTDVHRVYRNAISITSGSNYSFSFFVKKDTQRYIRLVLNQSSNSTVWVAAQFDLDTETFTSGVGSGGGTFLSASMVSAANGFYKITLVCSLATTSAFAFLVLSNGTAISSSDSRGCNVYLGDTLNRVYAWGAQFEQGAYATSYIKTTSATVTRLSDTFSRNNIYTNGLITSIGGTWFVELRNNIIYTRDISTFSFFIGDTSSGTTNSIVFRNQNTTARLTIARFISGAFGVLYNTTSDNVKIAIKWNGSTLDIFANGVKVVNGSVFTPTLMEFLATTTGTRDVPIFIQAMALYNTPLSDSDCITLTT